MKKAGIYPMILFMITAIILISCDKDTTSSMSGRYFKTASGDNIIIGEDKNPIIMTKKESTQNTFDNLKSGDKIEITYDSIDEIYPAQVQIFSCELIKRGKVSDIDQDSLERLKELGDKENSPMIKINYNINEFTIFDDNKTVVLNPEVKNLNDKNVQYHWTIEGGPALAFATNTGCSNEIINSGSFVSVGIFAEVSYVDENSVIDYKVTLKVEDKETKEVLAGSSIVIQDKAGKYTVQETE